MPLNKLPGPWRITFDTNPDDCNLHCIMCEDNSEYVREEKKQKGIKRRKQMSSDLIESVIDEAMKMGELKEIIPSTMGEPLLYKEFDKIIELCHKYNLKLNLTTNGSFPKKKMEEWAEILIPICSDIKISWNGSKQETAEKIMKGINFNEALKNLNILINQRDSRKRKGLEASTITLQLTFLEQNYKEIPDIIQLGGDLGVDRIKGHHLWVHNPTAEKWSMRRNSKSIENWNNMHLEAEKRYLQIINTQGKKMKIENIYLLSSEDDVLLSDSICPFLGREAWISNEGVFSPCCAPDYLRKQLGFFGSIKEKSLTDIWNSPEYEKLCDNYISYNLCKTCNMRKKREEVYKYEFKGN